MSQDLVLYWLAGLLEGEGTFLHGPPSSPTVPHIRVEMTDLDVIEHVAAIFRRTVQRHKQRDARHKPSFSTTVKGASAAHFMRLIRPLLGARRQAQVDAALAGPYNHQVRWLRYEATCTVTGCTRPGLKRSLCKQHYNSWWKARKRGRVSPHTPRGPALPEATLEMPSSGHPGAIPWLEVFLRAKEVSGTAAAIRS